MGKFCTRCGRPLQEGEICTCQTGTGQVPHMQQPMMDQVPPAPQQMSGQAPSMQSQQMSGQAPSMQQQQMDQVSPMQSQQMPGQAQSMQSQQMGQVPPMQSQQMMGQVPPMQQQQMGQIPSMQQQMMGQIPPAPQSSAHTQAAKAFAVQVKGSFLRLLKNPVTAGRDMIASADIRMAGVLFVLQGIASALFALAVAGRLKSYVVGLLGMAGGLMDFGTSASMAGVLNVPYVRIVLVTVLLSVLYSVILTGLLSVGMILQKCGTSWQQIMSAVAVRSTVLIPVILVSLLLFELKPGIGLFLFFAGNLWGFLTLAVSLTPFVPEKKKDLYPLMTSVAILLFILICIFIATKAWTLYLPDTIRTAFETMKSYIPDSGELFNDLMEEIVDSIF